MWSETELSHGRGKFVLTTNLVFHHRIANVFDQTAQFIRILDIVEKSLDLPLLCQRLEFLENLFKLPKDLCSSEQELDLRGFGLTVPTASSFLAL